ncbi:hypothetical protein [Tautonia sociabilis]|uniref:Uncharacterized protein n=1 Tax=Tautonia sociabilis TaxID=2080755 RepID=A0A432MD92_9BACT|nr:hypothetical protein [Tautonia sociabilis]RUL82203.1 hypothetical protein TsocGM_23740 [Tautonia sociabilis]
MPPLPTARLAIVPALLAVLLLAGCGGPSEVDLAPEDNPTFGPGGGPLSPLPGDGAFEVGTEEQGGKVRLVVTFFASEEANAPLSPPPSGVSIDLALPDGSTEPVSLAPDPSDPSRFVSSPGDYQVDPLLGTLNATVGGDPVSVAFSGVRY